MEDKTFTVDAWGETKDRILELEAEAKRLKESLPSPFDVYDKDDNWVCKDTDLKPSTVEELNEKNPAIRKMYEWLEEKGMLRVVTMRDGDRRIGLQRDRFWVTFSDEKGLPVDIQVAMNAYINRDKPPEGH